MQWPIEIAKTKFYLFKKMMQKLSGEKEEKEKVGSRKGLSANQKNK